MEPILCILLMPMLVGTIHHDAGATILIPHDRAKAEIAGGRALASKSSSVVVAKPAPVERQATLHQGQPRRVNRPIT